MAHQHRDDLCALPSCSRSRFRHENHDFGHSFKEEKPESMAAVREALERVKAAHTFARSHLSTQAERDLGKMFAESDAGFDIADLILAVLEVESLGTDQDERRRIARSLAWPISEALHTHHTEGFHHGYNACKAQITKRLFG